MCCRRATLSRAHAAGELATRGAAAAPLALCKKNKKLACSCTSRLHVLQTSCASTCRPSFCFFWNQKYTFSETIIHYSNLINISLGKFSIHPIYLSIYIGISLLMLVYLVNIKTNNYLKIVTGFGAIFLILILIVLMRKGPIIYLLIALFYLVKKYFKLTKTIFGVIVVALLMFLFLKIVPKYRNENRFEDLTENVLLEKPESSTAIRYKIYDCAIEKIIEKPIFGYGIGNVQNHLDPCYKSKNIDLSIKTYNCHNQFFSIILTAGFLGLILFLFTIYKIFKILKLNKSDIGISILLFFLLNFLTENVIERENGMLIYSFLLCFFLYLKNYLFLCVFIFFFFFFQAD
jgi:O-antigen ligase